MYVEAEPAMTGDASWWNCFRAGKNWLNRWPGNGLRNCAPEGRHWLMHLMRFWDANRNHEERTRAHSMTKRRGADENLEQE